MQGGYDRSEAAQAYFTAQPRPFCEYTDGAVQAEGPLMQQTDYIARPALRQISEDPTMERVDPENGTSQGFNFNVFNLLKQTAGCFCATTKELRKTIRQLEKTTKHLEKIIRQAVGHISGLLFGT